MIDKRSIESYNHIPDDTKLYFDKKYNKICKGCDLRYTCDNNDICHCYGYIGNLLETIKSRKFELSYITDLCKRATSIEIQNVVNEPILRSYLFELPNYEMVKMITIENIHIYEILTKYSDKIKSSNGDDE